MSGGPGIAGNSTIHWGSRHAGTRVAPLLAAVLLLAMALLAGCSQAYTGTPGPTRLTLWAHKGQDPEAAALHTMVAGFRKAHPDIRVKVTLVAAQDDYNAKVQAAIASGNLPDVFDLDGPTVAAYAYQGALTPLDGLLSSEARARMLPSLIAQGTWRGHLWAVGAFDSGLGMYGNRSQLKRAGVRIPTGPGDAWTAAEMSRALAALAAHDRDGKVIDLSLTTDRSTSEWLTYGFAPLLYSAGAALINPRTGRAVGTLDSPAAVRAVTALRQWATYTRYNMASPAAFTSGRVALSWSGHWTYAPYRAALGRDLVLIPLPDLGNGTKSGQGSWAWGIGAGTNHKAAAATLLDWLTNDAGAKVITDANGAVPGTRDALAHSALLGPGRPLHLFGDQLTRSCGAGPVARACITVSRPVTPAYPTVTAAFSTAINLVLGGHGDPKQALSKAARIIDANLVANHGFTQAPGSP